jgi:hypothetical protein
VWSLHVVLTSLSCCECVRHLIGGSLGHFLYPARRGHTFYSIIILGSDYMRSNGLAESPGLSP